MSLEEIAFDALCARVVAYVPQVLKAANHKNGASSVSFTTWILFLLGPFHGRLRPRQSL
jgi:hypothetical protein